MSRRKTTRTNTVAPLPWEILGQSIIEATRQNLSLACLIGAMSDGTPILWMAS